MEDQDKGPDLSTVQDCSEVSQLRKDFADLKETVNALLKRRSRSPSQSLSSPIKRSKKEEGPVAGPSHKTLDALDELSDSDSNSSSGEIVDSDLDELVEVFGNNEKTGAKIDEKLANLVDSGLTKKPSSDLRIKEVCEKYPKPENSKNLRVPKTNPELWKLLTKAQRVRDVKFQKTQNLITKSVIASAQLLDTLRTRPVSGKHAISKESKTIVTDILRLTSAAFTEISSIRKDSMKPGLSDQFKPLCSTSSASESTEFLFGDNLSQQIKDLGETSKITSQITSKNLMGGRPFRKQFPQSIQGSDPTKRRKFQHQKSFNYKRSQPQWKSRRQY